MSLGIWILIGIAYFIVGSIVAKLVDKFDIGEDFDLMGGTLREHVELTMVLGFLFWPLGIAFAIIVTPFYGIFRLVSFLFNKILNTK